MAFLSDFDIDYDNKIIRHLTGTDIYSTQTMYSELQDLFDSLNQMDDQVPMSAQTPTQFTMINGWFIDSASLQYIKTGSLTTIGWAAGIIRAISYNASGAGTMFDPADRGKVITGTSTGHTGKILGWDERYGAEIGVVYIRVLTGTFNNATEAWTVAGSAAAGNFTATFQAGGSATGENFWSQFSTLGTIHAQVAGTPDTKLYAVQDRTAVGIPIGVLPEHASATETNGALGSLGQIDVLVATQEAGKPIDAGRVQFFAHKEGTLYDNFEASKIGGNSVIAFATATDINNTDGTRRLTTTSSSGSFTVGEVIRVPTTPSNKGFVGYIRAKSGSNPTITLDIMQLGHLDIAVADVLEGVSSSAAATVDTITNINAAVAPQSDVTITFGRISRDLLNGAGACLYSVEIDCSLELMKDVYEVLQYRMRRGVTTDIDSGALLVLQGQFYKGIEVRLDYNGATGNAVVGEVVTGGTSGATGKVASATASGSGYLMVTRLDGTFVTSEQITTPTLTAANCTAVTAVSSPKAAAFGTFAGGKLFGARGVFVTNMATADKQNYTLIDDAGETRAPPNTVGVTVGGLVSGDSVAVFQVDSIGAVLKLPTQTAVGAEHKHATFNLAAGNNVGDLDIVITDDGDGHATIQLDVADGKDINRAAIRVIDTGLAIEDRYRFSSFSGVTFVLTVVTNSAGTLDGATSPTHMIDSTANWLGAEDVLVGDIVRNVIGHPGISYVTNVTATDLTISPPITGQVAGDTYEINRLVRSYGTDDDAYVPYLDRLADATSESNDIVQTTVISVIIRVRESAGAPIIPFESTGQIVSTGLSATATRTTDPNAT